MLFSIEYKREIRLFNTLVLLVSKSASDVFVRL